jgi:hypothetical protein
VVESMSTCGRAGIIRCVDRICVAKRSVVAEALDGDELRQQIPVAPY